MSLIGKMGSVLDNIFCFDVKRNKFFSIILLVLITTILFSFIVVYSFDKLDYSTTPIEYMDYVNLLDGQILEQNIKGYEGRKLSEISILFGTHDRVNNGIINVSVIKDGAVVEECEISASDLLNNQYKKICLTSPLLIEKKSEYSIRISERCDEKNFVAIYTNPSISGSSFSVAGKVSNGSICHILKFREISLIYRIWCFGIVICLFIILSVVITMKEMFVMTTMLLVIFCCYLFTFPLGMAPDEVNHFRRAFEIANVSLISQHLGENGEGGNYLPKAIIDLGNMEAELDWDETEAVIFENTALYSPVCYLPQAIGMRVTQLFTNRVRSIFWGGRVFGGIVCFLLCVSALYIIPFGRRVVFVLITFPLTMQEMVSLSPDGITISLSIFFLAYILKLTYGNQKVKKKDVIILALSGIVISLLKIVYVVILFLLLMIPNCKFNSKRESFIVKLSVIGISFLLNLIWFKISFGYLAEINEGVNSSEQVKFVLLHVLQYYAISVRTLVTHASSWVSTMISSDMGALNISTNAAVWVSALMLLGHEVNNCYLGDRSIRTREVIILLLSFIFGVALVFTSLYVQWTPLKNNIINGIQGRYFTPLVGCLIFAIIIARQRKFSKLGIVVDYEEKSSYFYLFIALENGLALIDMISYYISTNCIWGMV